MISNRITLKQLEAFVSVADTGSFRKAAAVLGTTQPNISVRIAALENTLDLALLHRDPGSVRVSKRGQEVLAAARQVLRATENVLSAASRHELIEDRLRLGVTELIAATWLHRFLRAFKDTYPNVQVELTVDLAQQIEDQLVAGDLDLAVLNGPDAGDADDTLALETCAYGWFAAPAIASGFAKAPSLSDLLEVGILSHGTDTQASVLLRQELKSLGLGTGQVAHCSSLTAALRMAVDGMGAALLPRPLVQDSLRTGGLIDIACAWLPPPLRFSARYDQSRAPLFVTNGAALAAVVSQEAQ